MSKARTLADLLNDNNDVNTSYLDTVDLTPVKQDVATLAFESARADNRAAYNLPNAFIDQFEDDSGIDTQTNTSRNASEYIFSQTSQIANTSMTLGWNGSTSNASSLVSGIALRNNDSNFDSGNSSNLGMGNGNGGYTDLEFARITMDAATTNHTPSSGSFWADGSSDVNWLSNIGSGKVFIIYEILQGDYLGFTPNGTVSYTGRNGGGSISDVRLYGLADSGDSFVQLADMQDSGTMTHGQTYSDTVTNSTSYPYLALRFTMSNSNHIGYDELGIQGTAQSTELVVSPTGNFTSTTQTASASVSSMSIVVMYEDTTGTATLNTDLVAQVSANNGTDFSTVTLESAPNLTSTIKVAKSAAISVTAGTQPKYKINFANQSDGSKVTRILGVSLLY